MPFDLTDYREGDEFEASARELNQVIMSILREGGSFDYEGISLTITSLPHRKSKPIVESIIEEEPIPIDIIIPETKSFKKIGRPRKKIVDVDISPDSAV